MEKPLNIFDLLSEAKRSGASKGDVYRDVSSFLELKARETATPYHGHFELTPLCNLDCKMCYVHLHESQMKGKKLLPTSAWITLMQQAIAAGMATASLSGGECLTYPGFDEVFLFLQANGIGISILTNGVLLNHERIVFFQKNRPRGIQITLYGHSEETYEQVTGKKVFTTVLDNIRNAKQAGLPIRLIITPSKYMADSVFDTIRLAQSLEIPFNINPWLVTPRDNTERYLDQHDLGIDDYVELFKYCGYLKNGAFSPRDNIVLDKGRETEYSCTGLKCGSGRSEFSVQWDGEMHPCILMDSISADPQRDGFLAAWKKINSEVSVFPSFNKCSECKYSGACGFCAAANEKLSSRYRLDPSWCTRTQKMVESGFQDNISCEQK